MFILEFRRDPVLSDSFWDLMCILTNNKTVIDRITLNVGLYLLRDV
jgi:hypothetical protein